MKNSKRGIGKPRFRLFVNNIQIGWSSSVRELARSALVSASGRTVLSSEWSGNTLYVKVA